MNQKIRCANPHCRRLFLPSPHVKDQRYCGRVQCRRYRKSRWQRQKMQEDPDYRLNHLDSQKNWLEKNPDYWRQYRSRHPDCVLQNRVLQRERDRKRRMQNLVKMDPSRENYLIKSGAYYLIPAKGNLAKMDPSSQKYFLLPDTYPFLAKKDPMDLSALPS